MKLYLDSRNQLVSNGFKTLAEDFFEHLSVEWYESSPQLMAHDSEEKHLVVYCFTDNLDELHQMLQNQPVPDQVIKVVLIVSGKLDGLSELVSKGVTGFFSLDCSANEFRQAFLKILYNQNYYCQELWSMILNGVDERFEFSELKFNLTNREIEVIEKLLKGSSTHDISIELGLSPHTVQTHRKNGFKKLNVRSLSELLLLEMKHKIFQK